MEVYVVYVLASNENNEAEILGIYKDLEKAKSVFKEDIEDNLKYYGYIYDNETPYTEKLNNGECMVRLFRGSQENWNDYLEIYIVNEEVE